jgi:HipA-like protein
MRSAEVSMHGVPSGILEEIEPEKKYRFTYFEKYTGPSIALTMPVDIRHFPDGLILFKKAFYLIP